MHALLPFTTDLIQAFGWTILHSFWQGCCVFFCLRIVLWLWPQAGPSIKYHLSFLSLTGIAGWFGATFLTQLKSIREASEAVVTVAGAGMPAMPVPLAFASTPAPDEGLKAVFPGMEAYFPLLVAIYVVGVTLMTIRLCVDLAQLKTLRKQGLSSLGSVWEEHLGALTRKMGIGKRVGLFISVNLQVPVMIGFIRPVILLPAAMVNNLSPEQLEAILLHELAHIKRNDYLLNIFQSIVETLLFFNPFVWWISRNIRLEREHCCDDLVLASTVQPMHYAKALVALEEFRLTVNPMAMAAAHDRHHLFHRIKRIMEMKTKHLNYSQRLLALMIIVTGLVSIAWLTPDTKRQQDAKTDTIAPKASPAAAAQSSPSASPSANTFITEPEIPGLPVPAAMPVPPSPPAPEACLEPLALAQVPSMPGAPPTPPAPPQMGIVPPAPPLPPVPPVAAWPQQVVFDRSTGAVYHFTPGDTVVPGGRIIIRDKQGKEKTYNSVDDMSAEEKREFEESYINMQKGFNFNQHFNFDKNFAFDSSMMKNFNFNVHDLRLQALQHLQDIDLSNFRMQLDAMGDLKWENLDESVKSKIKREDWEKTLKDARKSLEKIDWKAQQEEIRKNIEKLKKEELKFRKEAEKYGRDAAKYRTEAEKYHRDNAKFQAEAMAASQRARQDEFRAQAQRDLSVKHQTMARERAEREHERALRAAEAQRSLTEKNRATSRNYNNLLQKLESDKLIDRNEGFDIQKKGNDFFINGKKQPEDVKKKYEQYLENDNVTIRGKQSALQIHAQDNN